MLFLDESWHNRIMIEYTLDGKVAVIYLARHEKRNALNLEMTRGLNSAFDQVERDQPRIVVLTGQGSSFCAGADLDGALYDANFLGKHIDFLLRVQTTEIPVIAALNGPAMGAGLQLALAADIRIMDSAAKIGVPAPKIGVTVDAWTLKRCANLVGWGHARSLFFCLEEFSAQKCADIGFANKIADQTTAIDFAKVLSLMAPLTLRHYKKVFNDDGALNEVTENLQAAMLDVWKSEDLERGKQARITRILPGFTGS